MFGTQKPESITQKAGEGLKSWYKSIKDEYFELCWHYNLPPRDMSLTMIGRREISPPDRVKIIRLIIQLSDLEKLMEPGIIEDYLFAENEAQYTNSGIFKHSLH